MSNSARELVVATILTVVCLSLLALLPAPNEQPKISNKKLVVWFLHENLAARR